MTSPQDVSGALESAKRLLERLSGCELRRLELEDAALRLAGDLFDIAESCVDAEEQARRRRLSRLLEDPNGQLLTVLLTDRVARDKEHRHSARQLEQLIERLGVPRFMSPRERAQLRLGRAAGKLTPRVVGQMLARQIRREVEGLIVPMEEPELRSYLERRRGEGVRVNLNQLGEEVLGEQEAARRLEQYVALLSRPDVHTISVKLSSIFSQVDLFAWEATRERLRERMGRIYRAAIAASGSGASKLVYLDMEAYRDLQLTLDVVMSLLDEPEFRELSAGVVLQAYIPDSAALQRELLAWALKRRERGGAPVRLRIVKGANLAAERAHSSRMGWQLPIYSSKHEVDANYKRMLYLATQPAHAAAVHLGVASHNLFELALGLVLRACRRVEDYVGFEVLEGMANSMRHALAKLGAPVLVYAPAVRRRELDSAVAYLIRRLDENTAEENFLRHAFSMRKQDARYQAQAEAFKLAHRDADTVSDAPRRLQNRFAEIRDLAADAPFVNEPDTDFAVAAHRGAVNAALTALSRRPVMELASRIDGVARATGALSDGFDPSRPAMVPYRCQLAGLEELETAVAVAQRATLAWNARGPAERVACVRRVAELLRRRRAELIAAIVLDAGKRVVEADAEVSEAVDFAEYYLRQLEARAADLDAPSLQPKGVVLVTSPWNFPLAIPLSGVLAALLGGNAVIFKPAPEAAFVGERLAALVWEAGVPREALALVFCRDEDGSHLLRHAGVNAVVLTGATSTARLFLDLRPGLDLHAETGGKNAMIVSGLADRELAIRDLVASAFGYAGQKCSAASLAILLPEVYDDPHFRQQLRDAAASLAVGSAWHPVSVVTPLIRPPDGALLRGLTELDAGEAWLLEPRPHPDNPRLWSPGIRFGVAPRSFVHQTELFGPVLGVMRAENFEHALGLANATPYGLVAGLHSLDEREQARFLARAECGNLYVNRAITGAIVGRQPFGGHKASSVGPGAKAGGPNYVIELQDWADAAPRAVRIEAPEPPLERVAPLLAWARHQLGSEDWERLLSRVQSYTEWQSRYFSREHSTDAVIGQDNWLRYLPCRTLVVVAAPGCTLLELASAVAAALASGLELHISVMTALQMTITPAQLEGIAQAIGRPTRRESGAELAGRLPALAAERVRWVGPQGDEPPESLLRAAARIGCHVSTRPVVGHGRYELTLYHREQAISRDYHRYGHLGFRTPAVQVRSSSSSERSGSRSSIGPRAGR